MCRQKSNTLKKEVCRTVLTFSEVNIYIQDVVGHPDEIADFSTGLFSKGINFFPRLISANPVSCSETTCKDQRRYPFRRNNIFQG